MKTIKQLEEEIKKIEKDKIDGIRALGGQSYFDRKMNAQKRLIELKATLTQTKEIVKMIKELKLTYSRSKLTDYSEGYSNGWINACNKIVERLK